MSNFWKQKVAREYCDVKAESLKTLSSPYTTLYHISAQPLPDTLNPQIPAGSTDSSNTHYSAEPHIPRVCFSESVIGCVRATYANYAKFLNSMEPCEFYLYELVLGKNKYVPPYELAKRAVWDARVTGEWWALEPVKIKQRGKIRVTVRGEEMLLCRPFDGRVVSHSPILIHVENIG